MVRFVKLKDKVARIPRPDSAGSDQYGGIYIGSGTSVDVIYNNTVYNRVRPPLYVSGGEGNLIINNVFYVGGDAATPIIWLEGGTCRLLQNDYWADHGVLHLHYQGSTLRSLEQLRALGQEECEQAPFGLNVDPRLVHPGAGGTIGIVAPWELRAYCLEPDSPMLARGFDLRKFGVKLGGRTFQSSAEPPLNIGAN